MIDANAAITLLRKKKIDLLNNRLIYNFLTVTNELLIVCQLSPDSPLTLKSKNCG